MADLTDPFLLDLLPDVVQPALELVDFADRASDDLVEKGVVDGHVGVQAVVRGLEVDRLLEELAGKRGRVQRIRSMDHGLPWSRIRRVGRGRRRRRTRPCESAQSEASSRTASSPCLGGHSCAASAAISVLPSGRVYSMLSSRVARVTQQQRGSDLCRSASSGAPRCTISSSRYRQPE
jgi:hypothetical protein